jgi:hypothetical protein
MAILLVLEKACVRFGAHLALEIQKKEKSYRQGRGGGRKA